MRVPVWLIQPDFLWSFDTRLMKLHNQMINLEDFSQDKILEILDQFEFLGGYRLESLITEDFIPMSC